MATATRPIVSGDRAVDTRSKRVRKSALRRWNNSLFLALKQLRREPFRGSTKSSG